MPTREITPANEVQRLPIKMNFKMNLRKIFHQQSFWILIILISLVVYLILPSGEIYPNGSVEIFWYYGNNLDILIIDILHLGYPTAIMTNYWRLYSLAVDFFYITIIAFIITLATLFCDPVKKEIEEQIIQ